MKIEYIVRRTILFLVLTRGIRIIGVIICLPIIIWVTRCLCGQTTPKYGKIILILTEMRMFCCIVARKLEVN